MLIGVDCAADPANVGLALGSYRAGAVTLRALQAGSRQRPPAAIVAGWLAAGAPALLALDAPLGWPQPMAALAGHMAGDPPADDRDANRFFRRAADRFIRARLGQQPLDVGADRIARAAFAALWLLADLREHTGAALPLAWRPDEPAAIRAIEVYPAATLRARQMPHRGYKYADQGAARAAILDALGRQIAVHCDPQPMLASAHLLDAAVCLLAGGDFLRGESMPPPAEDEPAARREGWIWVRPPADSPGGTRDGT